MNMCEKALRRVYSRVAVGGTFDKLHVGHRALLRKAALIGDQVLVGVTSDEYVLKASKRGVEEYAVRAKRVSEFFRRLRGDGFFNVRKLDDPYGPAIYEFLDAIVVSEETLPRALELNTLREKMGEKALDIVVVGLVRDERGEVVSSTRIRLEEIDTEGRVLKRL